MNNSFDDQFRKQWEEQYFPVDDQHRKDMLTLLETNRRRKGIFWWFGGLAMAIAISGGLVYFMNDDKIESPVLPSPAIEETNAGNLAQWQNSNTENSNDQISELKNESSTTNVVSASTPKSDPKLSTQSKPSTATSSKGVIKSSDQTRKADVQKQNTDYSIKEKIFSASPGMTNREVVVIPNTSPAIISQAVAVVILPEEAEVIPNADASQRNTYVTDPVSSLFFSEITYASSNQVQAIKPSFHYHAINVFGESGFGFIPGLKNKYAAGWTFNAGAGAGYKLGAKTNVSLSAGYLLQNGGFDFERTSTVIQKDFGIRSNFNTLQPDKLHFIYSKIGMQYEVKRNLFSIFAGMQYLYGAQGNIVIKSTNQFFPVQDESRYTWLSMDGMRRWLWNGEMVYGYRLSPRLNIRAGMKYYFSSIKLDDADLSQEGYYWNGHYSSFSPTFTINYHLYGKR